MNQKKKIDILLGFIFLSLCSGKKLVESTAATEQPDLPLQE